MHVRGITALLAGAASLLLVPTQVRALDATWIGPGAEWTTGTNWSSSPTVPDNTATFTNNGAPTAVTIGASASINTLTFTTGAPAYTFTIGAISSMTFNVLGAGIVNNSSNAPSFVVGNISFGSMSFHNSSSAGASTINANGSLTSNLTFYDSATASSATIINNFLLNFNNTSTAGNATITNNFGTKFFDNSSAGNATITSPHGGLNFYNNSTAGNATLNFLSGTRDSNELSFYNNSSAGHAIINGSSNSGSTIDFYDNSTAASATINNLLVTSFHNSSSAGNATIVNGDNFSLSALNFFDNSTAGNAAIINFTSTIFPNAKSVTDFSATTGPNGDNKISAGSIAGDGIFFLGGNQLTVGSNGTSTQVIGVIEDGGIHCFSNCTGGSLVKVGAGTLMLSGMNTYTGATTVNGGVLEVDGSTAPSSLTTVNANAALTGTGTVGNTTIASGGLFAPGNGAAGSAISVSGNLAFQSGAAYLVQVNPAMSSFTSVTGTATLGGAAVTANFAAGSYVLKQYTILAAAGGVSGTFGALNVIDPPANFHTSLSYDANDVFLNVSLLAAPPSGLSGNQQGVSNAITNFFNTTGGIPFVFGTLTTTGLTQLSGESATGSQQTTFDAMTQFIGVMTDPFVAGRGDGGRTGANAPGYAEEGYGVSAYAPKDTPRSQSERDAYAAIYRKTPPAADPFIQRWSVWAAGFGGSQSTDGNAALGSNNTTSSIAGTAVGADYRFSPNTLAGFALAGGGTSFSVANGGSGHSDLFQAGAFIRHIVGQAYISGALAYGWQDITTNRTVSVAGIDQLRAEFNANAYSGRVESGYRFVTPWAGGVGITPYAAGQFTTFDLPAYAESVVSGTGNFALAYGARDVTDTRSELGIRTDKFWAMPNSWSGAVLTLRGRLAWAHDFDPDRSIGATFQTLPGASFVVNGAAQASDSALTTASIEMKWLNGWSAAATFEGEFSSVTSSYAGKGVVRYAW
jgi:autotransporter-associated beta strand protein